MLTSQKLVVGRIYHIRYNGEVRIVTIESHGYSCKSHKDYVTVSRLEDGKTVYRNYFLENIEVL